MLNFKLESGQYVKIEGNLFMSVDKQGNILINMKPLAPQKATLNSLQDSFDLMDTLFSDSPEYLKETKPVSVVKYEELKKKTEEQNSEVQKKQEIGEKIFKDFVDMWKTNFDKDGEQPNRVKYLQDMMNNYSLYVFSYLKCHKGLTYAVMDVLPQESNTSEPEHRKSCRMLAENMAQVSSIVYPPLSDLLTYPFHIEPLF